MPRRTPDNIIRKVLAASGQGQFFYVLLTHYRESDPVNAIGQVVVTEAARGGRSAVALGTNDALSALWVSPGAHVWAGAANGAIWTSAAVPWPSGASAEPGFQSTTPNLEWRRTVLPNIESLGYPPNVSCFWGAADDMLVAGTFQGSIYRWNGSQWSEMPGRPGWPIIDIHGSAPDDIYCVGRSRTASRYDGSEWQEIELPAVLGSTPVCTGVRVVNRETVYICSRSGHVVGGNAAGFSAMASAKTKFFGIALLNGRILLASEDGAWELAGAELTQIKPNFAAVDIHEAVGRVFFIESASTPNLQIIEYDPRVVAQPWGRREFFVE